MFRTFTCPSSGVLTYRLFHCRMWCYALGVVAVVLRSWCVVMCTVCQLVSKFVCIKLVHLLTYTGCPRRNVKYFGRVFLMLNYTDITQNTYIQS